MLTNNKEKVSAQYLEWRNLILNTQRDTPLKNIPDEVYGVLMDVGMGDGGDKFFAISMYALNSGEASLKASAGMGLIGLGEHKAISGIPQKIVDAAQSLVQSAKPTTSFAYAEANRVRFYFLMASGVRMHECGLNEIRPGHPYHSMFGMFSQIKGVADRLAREINQKKNTPQ